ncbi:hypothetical protein XELAEV_18028101mg [Xenopus laevis]|uniref:Uncharacterized protein n=1 Tax=Xenopus laevis TaxID=8355 RepID=A0A974CWM2_XENLA|nr:hypothetical protein XELAEV_18028101mg [Xenopus laevis]
MHRGWDCRGPLGALKCVVSVYLYDVNVCYFGGPNRTSDNRNKDQLPGTGCVFTYITTQSSLSVHPRLVYQDRSATPMAADNQPFDM